MADRPVGRVVLTPYGKSRVEACGCPSCAAFLKSLPRHALPADPTPEGTDRAHGVGTLSYSNLLILTYEGRAFVLFLVKESEDPKAEECNMAEFSQVASRLHTEICSCRSCTEFLNTQGLLGVRVTRLTASDPPPTLRELSDELLERINRELTEGHGIPRDYWDRAGRAIEAWLEERIGCRR